MRDVNQETITLNGFSLIRVKRRLHMRRREVCQNYWSRRTRQKSCVHRHLDEIWETM